MQLQALKDKNRALEEVVVQLGKQVGEMEALVSMCVDAMEAGPAHGAGACGASLVARCTHG